MYFDERENNLKIDEDINSYKNSITDNIKNYNKNFKFNLDNTQKYDNDYDFDINNSQKFDNDYKLNIDNININNFRTNNELFSEKEGLNKGNMFKNLYVPYKNYIYKVVVSGEKDELLLMIQELTFKVIDLNLYLDINPGDMSIYNEFKEAVENLKKYKDLYEKKYGPLCITETLYYDSFKWTTSPSPWKNSGGVK